MAEGVFDVRFASFRFVREKQLATEHLDVHLHGERLWTDTATGLVLKSSRTKAVFEHYMLFPLFFLVRIHVHLLLPLRDETLSRSWTAHISL